METIKLKYTPKAGGVDVERELQAALIQRREKSFDINDTTLGLRSYRLTRGHKYVYTVVIDVKEMFVQATADFVDSFRKGAGRWYFASSEYTGGASTYAEVVLTDTELTYLEDSHDFPQWSLTFEEIGVH